MVTDAWHPQVNGVVRTLTQMKNGLTARGWSVTVVGPEGLTMPCPTYPEIRLTLRPTRAILNALNGQVPEHIHIATEGPLGRAMMALCLGRGWRYTTSFHTRFPEYLKARFHIPRRWTYSYMRLFHQGAASVLVPTVSMRDELMRRQFRRVIVWGRGVDTELFHPSKRIEHSNFPRPHFLYVGRLAIEKNIRAFLEAKVPGTKIVVGEGPERAKLQREFPNAVFTGAKTGEDLARAYASADVFVFPSLTDTFGLVILEALASGTPVAAFRAPGPLDVIGSTGGGVLHKDLAAAALEALNIPRAKAREVALRHSWDRSVETFARALVPCLSFEQGYALNPHLPLRLVP